MNRTGIQKAILAVIAAGALAVALYQTLQASRLRNEAQTLQQAHQAEQADLRRQVETLQRQRDRASNELAEAVNELAAVKKHPAEVQKLRGEVGRLRRENAAIESSSPLSKVTANPEAVKMLREQQKMGMGVIYKGFAKSAKLTPEQSQRLNELLADHIMENVAHVTTALRDKPGPEQLNQVFAAEERVLDETVRELLGDDGLAQFKDYNGRLLSTLSAEQFKGSLSGAGPARDEKAKQLSQAIQESVQEALAGANLPGDYQAVPILNFRNIASEQEADRALKLLDDIYQRAAGRGRAFLSAEELARFEEFRGTALSNSRAALTLNRSMMAPIGQ